MAIAKVFQNGQSQAIRLPKEFRFAEKEVCVKRVGHAIMIYPKAKEAELFLSSLGSFSDDFFESILEARANEVPSAPRERL